MAKHEVRLSAQNIEIKGVDIDFEVKSAGSVLGTLSISAGRLEWRPKHGKKKIPINWEEFAAWAAS